MASGVYPRNELHREICRRARLGKTPWNKGLKMTQEQISKMSSPPHFFGEKSSRWIDGRSKQPEYRKVMYRLWRELNRDKIALNKRRRAWLKRSAGVLGSKTIQTVYENNILTFGKLTCVYCQRKIVFGSDTIDHVIPLKRGGNHDKNNLVIACRPCNSFKKDRFYEEFT